MKHESSLDHTIDEKNAIYIRFFSTFYFFFFFFKFRFVLSLPSSLFFSFFFFFALFALSAAAAAVAFLLFCCACLVCSCLCLCLWADKRTGCVLAWKKTIFIYFRQKCVNICGCATLACAFSFINDKLWSAWSDKTEFSLSQKSKASLALWKLRRNHERNIRQNSNVPRTRWIECILWA